MDIEINTGQGKNSFTTEKIMGCLKAVVLTPPVGTMARFRVMIESELGYLILHYLDLNQPIYLPVSKAKVNEQSQQTNSYTNFVLDEKLKITVDGAPNATIGISLRFE